MGLLVNERLVEMPGCGRAWCPWEAFLGAFADRAATCDLDKICDNGGQQESDGSDTEDDRYWSISRGGLFKNIWVGILTYAAKKTGFWGLTSAWKQVFMLLLVGMPAQIIFKNPPPASQLPAVSCLTLCTFVTFTKIGVFTRHRNLQSEYSVQFWFLLQ